jgi:hypothetical protein
MYDGNVEQSVNLLSSGPQASIVFLDIEDFIRVVIAPCAGLNVDFLSTNHLEQR